MSLRPGLHHRLGGLALLAGLPAVTIALVFLATSHLSPWLRTALSLLVTAAWLGLGIVVHSRWRYHLRTLSNLLAAVREGDYSFRVRGVQHTDPYGEVVVELNALSEILRQQRVEDLEATALVRKVMGEIDVAVFAFDASGRLRQVNEAGEQLLGSNGSHLGKGADEIGLTACLAGPASRTVELELAGGSRWEMRRGSFRQHGRPHKLLVLSDVSSALRAEELDAWKRLIRVIGHELNNSLAPIKSIAGSMDRLLDHDPLPEDWRGDLGRGLKVIGSRADALARFMNDCSRLAKMPAPTMAAVDVGGCVRRAAELETRMPITVDEGPEVITGADQVQLEQLFINLVKNAAEASLETAGAVEVGWRLQPAHVEVWVRDEGPGLPESANLFVPFFTTKPEGSGIGLFLCRQIAEAHDGAIAVHNRQDGPGCEAVVRLPVS